MTKIGLHFPQAEITQDSGVIRDFVQAAEEQGFSHINVPDHVIQTQTPRAAFPRAEKYTTEYPHHEVMTLLAYLAAVTRSIRLKTAVLILPQRQAVLVAKQAAQIDVLSDGRLDLGVGLGWNVPEYDSLKMNFKDRGKRLEEQIEVCRALWTEQHVNFSGQSHLVEDAGLAPMPLQRPIPVWIGALVVPAIDRAAKIADGWQAMFPQPSEFAEAQISRFKQEVKKAGRNPDSIGVETTIWATGDDPSSWLEEARQWIKIGATQIVFRPQGDFKYIQHAIEKFAPLLKEIS